MLYTAEKPPPSLLGPGGLPKEAQGLVRLLLNPQRAEGGEQASRELLELSHLFLTLPDDGQIEPYQRGLAIVLEAKKFVPYLDQRALGLRQLAEPAEDL